MEPYITYSPICARPRIEWPGGARVALWIAPNIEFYEYLPPPNKYRRSWGRVPKPPDVMLYSGRDYGNRIGFWRMLEVLDAHGVRPTASLNVAVLDHFPEIHAAMVARDWEYMSHGIYNTRYLFGITEEEERAYMRDNVETIKRHTGKKLKGMFGPAASVTPNTWKLMAEAGLIYSCDWFLDDQPFPVNVPNGKLIGVPYAWEVNDGLLMTYGFGTQEADYFVQVCKDQFDTLYEEGAVDGRVMCVALHPYIIGHPHRIEYLDEALGYLLGHEHVWLATAEEIADYYLKHYYDESVAELAARAAE